MWLGFITESKKFMNYPKFGRLKFWLRFPKAYIIYIFLTLREKLR